MQNSLESIRDFGLSRGNPRHKRKAGMSERGIMWSCLYYRDRVQSQALPMAVLYLWVPKENWISCIGELYHIVVLWPMAPFSLAGGYWSFGRISTSLETEQYSAQTATTTPVWTGERILWWHTLQYSAVFLHFLKWKFFCCYFIHIVTINLQ
jgi:hypothetical protein